MQNNQLDDIVKNLVEELQGKINKDIERNIITHVNQHLSSYDFEGKITLLASLKLDNKIANYQINPDAVEEKINSAAHGLIENISKQARNQITSDISRKIDSIDFNQSITNAVAQQLEARIKEVVFPANSISFQSIKKDEIEISGDNINGGIITKFGSTGIDDQANNCIITILDDYTVIENNLVVSSASVKGSLVVEGDLLVTGELPTDSNAFKKLVEYSQNSVLNSIDQTLFDSYKDTIFNQITEQGIELNKITIGKEIIIENNKIGNKITESNLQKLGLVRDLQTRGETFLSEVLYVSSRRVGINTIEPSHTLSLWDQEVEIVSGKQYQNAGFFGTPRGQDFIVSSNGKNNIICKPDGSVTVMDISIGSVLMTSSDTTPSTDKPKGSIVWNSNPSVGNPIGWVSLGGARWAKFGTIES